MWMKNQIIGCSYSRDDREEELIQCNLALDDQTVFRFESGQVIRGRSCKEEGDRFKLLAELRSKDSPELPTGSIMRCEVEPNASYDPAPIIVRIRHRLNFAEFRTLGMNIRKHILPHHLLVSFQGSFSFDIGPGRKSAIAIHDMRKAKQFIWKNVSIGNEHPVEQIIVSYQK